MKNTQDTPSITFRALIKGLDKNGKSTAAATWPDPLFVDVDRAMSKMRGVSIDYEDFIDFEETKVYAAVEAFLKEHRENPKYKTIVIDTFNRLDYYLCQEIKPNGRFEFGEWGIKLQKNIKFLTDLMTIQLKYNKNIVVLVHEKLDRDELSNKVSIVPALQGAITGQIGGFFDDVFHIEKVLVGAKREFRFFIENQGLHTAGSKTMDWKGELSIPAHYNEILKRMKGQEVKK